ncbi:acyloxyacyl hydrolase [Thalassotalea euphylliae]|uniref:Lipid A deacylase n=1 Tax=Thalassotalea euphylliae TaxID=1655234 RepID=A0A3E0TX84_9GAMM|nr:acyloxyacyl hydrolase [Thalassotalea euphylliae]REL29050.1 acyloxyacyl hydrolase [Thalassotalea euphylliae]
MLSAFASHSSERQLSQAIAVDVLIGSDDINGLRLAYRPHIYHLKDILFVDQLDIYWEVSVNFWEYGESNQHETNYVLAFSPVIGQTFHYIKGKYPLRWEFGIGVSLVEDTRFAGKDIGSHYQFEDRLGLAIDFGQNNRQSAAIRYMHYSNGGLNSKNPGVDFLNLSYAYSF